MERVRTTYADALRAQLGGHTASPAAALRAAALREALLEALHDDHVLASVSAEALRRVRYTVLWRADSWEHMSAAVRLLLGSATLSAKSTSRTAFDEDMFERIGALNVRFMRNPRLNADPRWATVCATLDDPSASRKRVRASLLTVPDATRRAWFLELFDGRRADRVKLRAFVAANCAHAMWFPMEKWGLDDAAYARVAAHLEACIDEHVDVATLLRACRRAASAFA